MEDLGSINFTIYRESALGGVMVALSDHARPASPRVQYEGPNKIIRVNDEPISAAASVACCGMQYSECTVMHWKRAESDSHRL